MGDAPADAGGKSATGIHAPGPWRDIDTPNLAPDGPLVHPLTVGWGDCDPAQIAYTARIPAWGLEAIEAWYRYCLGINWYRLNLHHGIGTPFVSLGFEFKAPVVPMAPLEVEVRIARLGNSSLSHRVRGRQNGVLCFKGETTSAFVEAAVMKPMSIPPNMRTSIEHYQSVQGPDSTS
jgi:acyl-CoA thioesterase FadM